MMKCHRNASGRGISRNARSPSLRSQRPHPERQGAATVELALCLPLIVTLTVGICEVGQALKVEAILSQAARAGCGTGSRPGCSNDDVRTDVLAVLMANKIPTETVSITILVNDLSANVVTATGNDKISVKVAIPIASVNWTNTRRYFGAADSLSQTVVMAKQG